MTKIFPSFENIERLKVQPTKGEWELLRFLKDALDDSYEVYFQPYINGDNPDIIIMKKSSGVMIVEVKDWDIKNYEIDEKNNWRLKKNKTLIKSPVKQVNQYKDNLFTLHIRNLLEKTIETEYKNKGIVSCVVYFSQEKESDLQAFSSLMKEANQKYTTILGSDSLNVEKFSKILYQKRLTQRSKYFSDELYEEFKRYLKPTIHTLEDGKTINLTSEQKRHSQSLPNKIQKIKGVAGCGKTIILSQRAVNAHKRTRDDVLILTYNITLKNYIHVKISDVRENFFWSNFYITNYHSFMETQFNNLEIQKEYPEDFDAWDEEEKEKYWELNYYSNLDIFSNVLHKIKKYSAIFIDEIQDYKKEWQYMIRDYFLRDNGELVLFGDEKQNIYDLPLDKDKKSSTIVIGRWNELKQSFRLNTKISEIALQFQKYFFENKYELDEIEVCRQNTIYNLNEEYNYLFFNEKNYNLSKIVDEIYQIFRKLKIHPNDICFLSPQIKILREIDYLIRKQKGEKTNTMFETQEMYKHLEDSNKFNLNQEIKKIRSYKKFHFWRDSGTVKLSTIHSYKGWEVDTLVLVIENYEYFNHEKWENFAIDELIYTGITRCRDNLIVVNLGNMKYHRFFDKVTIGML